MHPTAYAAQDALLNHPHLRRDTVRVGQAAGDNSALWTLYSLAGVAGTAIGAYHGYKRNDSVGWGVVWGLLGGLFPIIVIPVAFAQGIDKKGPK